MFVFGCVIFSDNFLRFCFSGEKNNAQNKQKLAVWCWLEIDIDIDAVHAYNDVLSLPVSSGEIVLKKQYIYMPVSQECVHTNNLVKYDAVYAVINEEL